MAQKGKRRERALQNVLTDLFFFQGMLFLLKCVIHCIHICTFICVYMYRFNFLRGKSSPVSLGPSFD